MKNIKTILKIWNILVFILLIGVSVLVKSKLDPSEEFSGIVEVYLILTLSYLVICLLSDIILYSLGLAKLIKTNYVINNNLNSDGYYLKKDHIKSSTKYTVYRINYKTHKHESHYYTSLWVLIPFFSIFSFIVEEDYNDEVEFIIKNEENTSIFVALKSLVDRFTLKNINSLTLEHKFIEESTTNIIKVMNIKDFTPKEFKSIFDNLVKEYEEKFIMKYKTELSFKVDLNQINKFTTLEYNK